MTKLTLFQRAELIQQYVELQVDNMDHGSLVEFVTTELQYILEKYSDEELKEDIEEFDDGLYNELVENVTHVKCESNNKNNVTYNEVDYVEQCITEGYDYRDCVDTLPGINNTGGKY